MRRDLRTRLMPLHDALDREITARCLGDPPDLAALLRLHAAVLPGLAAALEAAGVARLYPAWDGADRVAALRGDLARLGVPAPPPRPAPAFAPAFASDAGIAGALYALEGSRLGNQALLRRVLAAGGARERAALSFLRHGHAEGAWPRFLAWLAERGGQLDIGEVARGAETVFAAYAGALPAPDADDHPAEG